MPVGRKLTFETEDQMSQWLSQLNANQPAMKRILCSFAFTLAAARQVIFQVFIPDQHSAPKPSNGKSTGSHFSTKKRYG